MRVGDFVVEVVPHGAGRVRELDTGHVLARPGQVYSLRLRNMGPLRCVADITIDDRVVTRNGLVLDPFSTEDLERPIDDSETGRFTVIAEGNEAVFGPDGGRDNPKLGLIDAKFRRELPSEHHRYRPDDFMSRVRSLRFEDVGSFRESEGPSRYEPPDTSPLASMSRTVDFSRGIVREPPSSFESAAGTGLTGHSDQTFRPIKLGALESEATTIQLRIVIGTEAAIAEQPARPLPGVREPARPAARP
jgi:hypothetical protein